MYWNRSTQRPWLLVLSLAMAMLSGSAARADELEGSGWRGTWTDNNRGHEGPLRGRFRAADDMHYRAVFTGRFYKVIPFRFATTLDVVERQGDQVILAGESRLPFFGRFSYRAVADEHHFNTQYQSRRWTGEFNLSR